MWDLRSPSKDWTHTLCLERRNLNHCTTREVPQLFIKAFSSWLWQRLKEEECFSGLLHCYSVLTACWSPAKEDGCLSCHYRPGSKGLTAQVRRQEAAMGPSRPRAQRFAVTVMPSVCGPQPLLFQSEVWGQPTNPSPKSLLDSQAPPWTCRIRVCLFRRFPGVFWTHKNYTKLYHSPSPQKNLGGESSNMLRIIKYEQRKLKMLQINGKISHALGFGRLLLKWSYHPKQSIDLMWSLSNYPWHFHRTRTNNPKIYMEP